MLPHSLGVPCPRGQSCPVGCFPPCPFLPGDPTYLRLLPGPPPAPLLCHVLLPLGSQGLAGFGAGFAHRPSSSGEEEQEREEGWSAMAHASQCCAPQAFTPGQASTEGHGSVSWGCEGRWEPPELSMGSTQCGHAPATRSPQVGMLSPPSCCLAPLWGWGWPVGYQHGQEVTRTRIPPLRMPLRDKFKLRCAASALLQPFPEVWLHPAPLPAWGGDQPMPRALPGPTGENPKASLRTMPRRDPPLLFFNLPSPFGSTTLWGAGIFCPPQRGAPQAGATLLPPPQRRYLQNRPCCTRVPPANRPLARAGPCRASPHTAGAP